MLIAESRSTFCSRFKHGKQYVGKHFTYRARFNLIRKHAHRRVGGHAALRLAILDDMLLGKLLKTGVVRSRCCLQWTCRGFRMAYAERKRW